MGYTSLSACVSDLEKQGQLVRCDGDIDPFLELAAIQRRLYAKGSPAVLFTRVRGTVFPCLANLYGTRERVQYLFRDTQDELQKLLALAGHPGKILKSPFESVGLASQLFRGLPQKVSKPSVMAHRIRLSELPQIQSWRQDGGAYITLPQVYTEHPETPGWMRSNLGMYRVQLSSSHHAPNHEVGLHYQIHRGIGVHHEAAIRKGEALRVSIFIGGPPAHALAAVMPLPEGLPEIAFAGILAGRRFRYARNENHFLSADSDFCIVGTLDTSKQLPEGPFGDHLGYYSLTHDFPVLNVEAVYHKTGAIWPFTVVGRPPQEDSHFAEWIHDITRDAVSLAIPGIKAVHAVEVAGVHPLLLATGSERYMPFGERKPRELLTQAHAILGFGQLSLAKFLWLSAWQDAPDLDIHDVPVFFKHMLERIRFDEDLHFVTRTTIDTLDYSGHGLNQGSKAILVAAGNPVRVLSQELPPGLAESMPVDFPTIFMAMPGVVVVQAPAWSADTSSASSISRLVRAIEAWALKSDASLDSATATKGEAERKWETLSLERRHALSSLPLWVLVDDLEFCRQSLANFLWVTFTRCDPAPDSSGAFAFSEHKHWGCLGPWVLDSRSKSHHAPVLEEDPKVNQRIESLAVKGGPLFGLI